MSSNSETHNGDSKLTGGTADEEDLVSVSSEESSQHENDAASVHANSAKAEEYHGAKRDNRKVYIWMLLVLIMIGGTTALVLGFTNKFLLDEETAEFENGFRQHVSAVGEGTIFHAKTVINYMESIAETITSYAAASDAGWPFITVPDYVRRGQRTIDEARFDMIGFSPIVDAKHLDNWSNFAGNQTIYSLYGADSSQTIDFPTAIHDLDNIFVLDKTAYVPFWMSSPKPYNVSVVNLDLLSRGTFQKAFQSMQTSEQTVVSELYSTFIDPEMVVLKDHVFPPGFFEDKVVKNDFGIPLNTNGNKQKGNDGEVIDQIPHSVIMTPVFDTFDLDQRSLVGVVYGIISWDKFFVGLLPEDVNGIIAVLKDTCGNRQSFVINGKDVAYIGEGDVEGTNNAYISQNIAFGSVFAAEGTDCVYSLAIYPSENFEALFYSSARSTFLPFFGGVFAALGIMFLLFFWFVERRQQKIVNVAQRTTAIVSSLFPDNVRDRIMKQAEEQARTEIKNQVMVAGEDNQNLAELLEKGRKQEVAHTPNSPSRSSDKSNSRSSGTSNRGILRIRRTGGKRRESSNGSTPNAVDAPIADRYPDCTVFFADIVGFTSWSSTREPTDVFVLLETLYGSADKIARSMGVFKVETIGDCYVAATGLPNPRLDHAVAMARFACRFLHNSREVFQSCAETLGPETSKLDVRIGLHSGPVTAGVLRGEKSRFQLFGDTVNTAARMESNSRTGRIHCSQSTADLLIEGGKEAWIMERKDKIVAKGKGEMQTYFLDIPMSDAKSRRSGGTKKAGSRRSLHSSSESGSSDALSDGVSGTPFKMGSRRGVEANENVRQIASVPSLDSDDMGEL